MKAEKVTISKNMELLNGEYAFSAKRFSLTMRVAPCYVAACVALEIPRRSYNYVAFADPDSPLHFAAYSAEPLFSVLAFDHDAVEAE